MQIFQTCHSDAKEQKEEKRKLGKPRSYGKPSSSRSWAQLATLCCGLNERLSVMGCLDLKNGWEK